MVEPTMSKISILLRLLSSCTIPLLQQLSQNSKQPFHKTLEFKAAMSDDNTFTSYDQSFDCPPSYSTHDHMSHTTSDNFCSTASHPPTHNTPDHILSPLQPAHFPDAHHSSHHFSAPSDPNYDIEAATHVISAFNTTNFALSALQSNAAEAQRTTHIPAAEAPAQTRSTALTTPRRKGEPPEDFKACCFIVLALVIVVIFLSILLSEAKKDLKNGKVQGLSADGRLSGDWDDWNALDEALDGLYRGIGGVEWTKSCFGGGGIWEEMGCRR